MSWNAVFPYKGKPASPGEIARSLAVRYQVEGSVRQTGDRVRVIAQLVDTEWPGALVRPLRRGARGSLCPAGQDHHSDRRRLGDPRDADRATAGVRQADRKSRSLRLRAARQAGAAAPDARKQCGGARAAAARDRARSELRRRLCRARRDLLHRRVDGLGGIADGIPEPCGGNGEQGAEPQRFRSARAHHPRPHPYLLSPIRPGQGGDGPCDRDQSERCPWPRRPRQYPDVVGTDGCGDRGIGAGAAHRSRAQCDSIALRSASPTI